MLPPVVCFFIFVADVLGAVMRGCVYVLVDVPGMGPVGFNLIANNSTHHYVQKKKVKHIKQNANTKTRLTYMNK